MKTRYIKYIHLYLYLKFDLFDYFYCLTHTQSTVAAAIRGWGGYTGEIIPSRAFSFYFLVP